MGIFSRFQKDKTLVLARASRETWPEKLVKFQELDKVHAEFLKNLNKEEEQTIAAAHALLKLKSEVPERAHHITREHAKVLCDHVERLCTMEFTEIFHFPQELENALQKISTYKEHAQKNISALLEYYEEELAVLQTKIEHFEDALIKTGEVCEQKKLRIIITIRTLLGDIEKEEEKHYRFDKTKEKYYLLKQETEEKQKKHQDKIKKEELNVRGPEALKALSRIKEIEEEAQTIKSYYDRLVFDTKRHILKNKLTLSEQTKTLFETLAKDTNALQKYNQQLAEEFKSLHHTLTNLEIKDEKQVTNRLLEASKKISKDITKLEEHIPRLQELKKDVMQDIAALNIYEQQQFLLRTKKEAAEIQEKIDYITTSLGEIAVEEINEGIEELLKNFTVLVREED